MTEIATPGTPEHGPDTGPGAEPMFARSATVGPFGKLDAELKTVVDVDTLELIDRKARLGGVTRSDVMRNLAYLFAHGKSFDALQADAANRRMRLMLGEGLELAHEISKLHVRGEVS